MRDGVTTPTFGVIRVFPKCLKGVIQRLKLIPVKTHEAHTFLRVRITHMFGLIILVGAPLLFARRGGRPDALGDFRASALGALLVALGVLLLQLLEVDLRDREVHLVEG